jgi:hypothetical protein
MSFKPSRPPNEAFPAGLEYDLPADLAALGEQLHCDAERLSQVYPPCAPPQELLAVLAVRSGHRRWNRWQLATAASAAAVLLVVGWGAWSWLPERNAPPGNISEARLPRPELAIADFSGESGQPPVATLQPTPVSYRPAVMELNGPQLEGLLDLWNEQPAQKTAVSF